MFDISVIVCSYNPRPDYLNRVLRALESQSLSKSTWELILIDNASDRELSLDFDIKWHPNARFIRESQLGIAKARLKGLEEAIGNNLVFVDDDNVLDPDYLEVGLEIANEYKHIGVWGGQIRPEFEKSPPEWTKDHWWRLAIIEFNRDCWSNVASCNTHPVGTAGMFIRKTISNEYIEMAKGNERRKNLGQKGAFLNRCEDLDLAFTAIDMGWGMGRYVDLKLTHLLPSSRFDEEYLLRLTEGNAYSNIILRSLREEVLKPKKGSIKRRLFEFYKYRRLPPRERRFYDAQKRGEVRAFNELFEPFSNSAE